MSYITAIGIANPPHRIAQQVISDFMVKAMQLNEYDSRKLRTVFKASGIEYRHSVLEDYGRDKNFSFYSNSPDFEPFPSTEKRMELFRQQALPLSKAAVLNMLQSIGNFDLSTISHLVLVCCTGMYAPGLDIELVKELGLRSTIERTCITFMGCYAAFNALKVADAFCKADENAKVLLVSTELCSIHFQKEPTEDNILANALFADGSAAMLVEANSRIPVQLKLEKFHSDLAIEGEKDMAWAIGDLGFEMRLSSYVPDIIRGGIKKFADALLQKLSKNIADIKYFVIHPGGKKILETIEQQLGIEKEQNTSAYHVLKNFGNMSSPTVVFVLHELMKSLKKDDDGEYILSFAFGPGLTMESMLLKIEIENDEFYQPPITFPL